MDILQINNHVDYFPVVAFLLAIIAICLVCVLITVVKLLTRESQSDDDPTGEIKQRIFDKLEKAKKQIQSIIQ